MAVTTKQIEAALLAFDRDADGRLNPNEVTLAQLATGVHLGADERERFEKSIGAKPLDYAKAIQLIEEVVAKRNPKEELLKMFAPFDVKKDGTISAAEMKAVFENLGELLSAPQVDKLTTIFTENDKLRYKDLIEFMLT